MIARIPVAFEDINWESWAACHNLRATLEPVAPLYGGGFELVLVGWKSDIEAFRRELGY